MTDERKYDYNALSPLAQREIKRAATSNMRNINKGVYHEVSPWVYWTGRSYKLEIAAKAAYLEATQPPANEGAVEALDDEILDDMPMWMMSWASHHPFEDIPKELYEAHAEHARELDRLERENTQLTDERDQLREALDVTIEARNDLARQVREARSALGENAGTFALESAYGAIVSELEAENEHLRAERDKWIAGFDAYTEKADTAQKQVRELEAEVERLRAENEQLRQDVAHWRTEASNVPGLDI